MKLESQDNTQTHATALKCLMGAITVSAFVTFMIWGIWDGFHTLIPHIKEAFDALSASWANVFDNYILPYRMGITLVLIFCLITGVTFTVCRSGAKHIPLIIITLFILFPFTLLLHHNLYSYAHGGVSNPEFADFWSLSEPQDEIKDDWEEGGFFRNKMNAETNHYKTKP